MLNDYYEAVVTAVLGEGGEKLKFMGDGLLAIFELAGNAAPASRCAAALRAADVAAKNVASRNLERRVAGEPEIAVGN
jgi:adenylate cyclase